MPTPSLPRFQPADRLPPYLLMGLLLSNLLLYRSVRDRAYLIYVAFVGGMAVAAAFGILFARNFLAGATRLPERGRS